MIEIKKYSELETQTRDRLHRIIDDEFGHIPIVKETHWATPDWTIIRYEKGDIATSYNVIERTISVDHEHLKAAGINNVITPLIHRGKGFSSKLLKETENFLFEELKVNLGLLLCADNLLPFYERLGWYKVEGSVYFDQPSGKKLWTANTMILSKNERIYPSKIDLNGLPW